MAQLLTEAAARGMQPDYIRKLLAAFKAEEQEGAKISDLPPASSSQPLGGAVEPTRARGSPARRPGSLES